MLFVDRGFGRVVRDLLAELANFLVVAVPVQHFQEGSSAAAALVDDFFEQMGVVFSVATVQTVGPAKQFGGVFSEPTHPWLVVSFSECHGDGVVGGFILGEQPLLFETFFGHEHKLGLAGKACVHLEWAKLWGQIAAGEDKAGGGLVFNMAPPVGRHAGRGRPLKWRRFPGGSFAARRVEALALLGVFFLGRFW